MNLTRVLPSNRNISNLDLQCKLTEPIEIGHFFVDGEGTFYADRHQLSIIYDYRGTGPKFDLNDGYEDRHIRYQNDTQFDCLLRWMLMNKNLFVSSFHKKEKEKKVQDYPDFIFLRGRPVKLMRTPYEKSEGWKMACQKLHETIYIIETDTEKYQQQDRLVTFRERRFEGYMTKRAIDQDSYVVNENEAFYSVLRSTLNQHHSFVYGCKIDSRRLDEELKPPDCYIELKTAPVFTSEGQRKNFYRSGKALKWWAQCYFACVPQITCGFRDDDGFVRTVDTFSTWELPRIASRLPNSWDPVVCLNFLDVLLTDIKELFRKDKSVGDSVVIICWDPGDEHVRYYKDDDYLILPDWYIEEVTSHQTT